MTPGPRRILFVFAWLVVGGEETELRLLVRHLDPRQYRIDVVACFRQPGMTDQTHDQLAALGVDVDTAPYVLSFEDTVAYLARKIPGYDIVVGCQDVPDLYPALERLRIVPPVIEHGGLVREALAGPKHFTTRYVGVCRSIRDAAATRMPDRPSHAIEIPSMVDLSEFDQAPGRADTRGRLGIGLDAPLVGWVGRLDRKKRVEDFIAAAATVHRRIPAARFLVIGGPDAFMSDYSEELRRLAAALGLSTAMMFLGDRSDVPALLRALDVFVWLARGEGMPHVIAEAGAARLPVVATPDNGTLQQITDGESGIFVAHENPPAVAAAVVRLLQDGAERRRLGDRLRRKVEHEYAVSAVIPQWECLFRDVLREAEAVARQPPKVFTSFWQCGVECSTHRLGDGRRLDMLAAVSHDTYCAEDYAAMRAHGLLTVRDGVRWHLVERQPGAYDWSSLLPMLRAARRTGTQIIWDLQHYGWPDGLDIWRPEFVERYAQFASAAAAVIRAETAGPTFYVPFNEISFQAWGGGDVGYLNPFARHRGFELKVQLARAAIAAMEGILAADGGARFVHADPAINIASAAKDPQSILAAESACQAQYQGWDMLSGRLWPQLGGKEGFLDIIGLNYYSDNQWLLHGPPIDHHHRLQKPFRKILAENYARYGRPILVSETGIEGEKRVPWLAYIGDEVRAAMRSGVPVLGVCLYPVINHPGWDDNRYCENGLFHAAVEHGSRAVYQPLAGELARQIALTAKMWDDMSFGAEVFIWKSRATAIAES